MNFRFKPGELVFRSPAFQVLPLMRRLHQGSDDLCGMFSSGIIIANGGRPPDAPGERDDWILVLDSASQALGWALAYELRRMD